MRRKFRQKERSGKRAALFFALTFSAAGLGGFEAPDLGALSQRVKELMARGQFEEAIPICEQLVRALPGNTGLVLNLGLAEQMAGHPDKAIPRFEEVLKAEPRSVPALSSLASSQLQVGQSKAAVASLRRLLALQPADRNTRQMLAGALFETGELQDAAVLYRKLSGETGANSKTWYGLGRTYEELSARLYERLTRMGPQSAHMAALIGASRLKSQQYHSAFFFFKEAERIEPRLRGVHSALAVIYRKAGHGDWAATEESAEDQVAAPDCAKNLAECLFVQNRYVEAADAAAGKANDATLYWAIKANQQLASEAFAQLEPLPESVEVHAWRAKAAHERNRDLEAAGEWRAAVKLSPGNRRLEGELATALFLAHDYGAAIPLIEAQIQADSKAVDLNFMMGESMLRTERPEDAIGYLKTALEASPQMLPARASLGLALAKLKRDREAIGHLEAALELDDDGALHYQLARAYERTGNTSRADALMEKYQEIQKRNQQEKEEITQDVQITGPDVK